MDERVRLAATYDPPIDSDLKELQELLKFGFDLQNTISLSLSGDGKIDLRDLPYWLALLVTAGPAFNNLGNPWRRYRALSGQERLQLLAWAKQEFRLPNPTIEDLVEATLDVAYAVIQLVRRWQATKK